MLSWPLVTVCPPLVVGSVHPYIEHRGCGPCCDSSRLSRSLLDFARLLSSFEKRGVSFVSLTQEFNTSTSLGRLTLHILLSFVQFEREIISGRVDTLRAPGLSATFHYAE